MDAPGLLVVVLGLLAGGGLAWGVVGWQRAALARARVQLLERDLAARRGTVRALADLAAGRWDGDSIRVRGAVPVSDDARRATKLGD